ncbi:hypothetical protein GCM10009850_032630 [Nonomuraea monospora]|uniref:Uncharacterized protein n=1 Tax=Nonomuraea monospora TaxID=568818 RepID=A0ABN3CF77_9ACTN
MGAARCGRGAGAMRERAAKGAAGGAVWACRGVRWGRTACAPKPASRRAEVVVWRSFDTPARGTGARGHSPFTSGDAKFEPARRR